MRGIDPDRDVKENRFRFELASFSTPRGVPGRNRRRLTTFRIRCRVHCQLCTPHCRHTSRTARPPRMPKKDGDKDKAKAAKAAEKAAREEEARKQAVRFPNPSL